MSRRRKLIVGMILGAVPVGILWIFAALDAGDYETMRLRMRLVGCVIFLGAFLLLMEKT
jgi:hypothetical protein